MVTQHVHDEGYFEGAIAFHGRPQIQGATIFVVYRMMICISC